MDAKNWKVINLKKFFEETKIEHGKTKAVVASVGKNGIRDRSEIYSKELSKDYSRNKLVKKNEIAFGLASDAIVYGVNTSDKVYSVSPAYKVFRLVKCNSLFMKYYLDVHNQKLSLKFLITSARQGKSIDFNGLFKEEIELPSLREQEHIVNILSTAQKHIELLKECSQKYHEQKRGLMQKLLTGEWRVK